MNKAEFLVALRARLTDHVLVELVKDLLGLGQGFDFLHGGLGLFDLRFHRSTLHAFNGHLGAVRADAHAIGGDHVFDFAFSAATEGTTNFFLKHFDPFFGVKIRRKEGSP